MITRRAFIRTIGKGSAAVALVGVTACTSDEPANTTGTGESTTSTGSGPSTTTTGPTTTAAGAEPSTTVPVPSPGAWSRVTFGFVSAYLLVRNGEAALVDTGTAGNASQVETTLDGLGLRWGDLSTIVLTHHHGDHIGSLPDIMDAATGATGYAGAEDIPNITSPRPITAVGDGETVFGLQVVTTPGHTPGHISILDPAGSALIAGDAIVGENGGVAGPVAQFTADLQTANASVAKLAGLDFDVVYFGHGEPVTSDASGQVAELASSL